MKKTILLTVLTLLSVFTFVQAKNIFIRMASNTTDWSNVTVDANNVILDYTQGTSFNTFVNDTVEIGDIAWVAKGTYTVLGQITMKTGCSLIGGFNGTETSLSQRSKNDLDGNGMIEPWEFVNSTNIVGGGTTNRALQIPKNTIAQVDGLLVRNITASTSMDIIKLDSLISSSTIKNMTVQNCTIAGNDTINRKGAIYAMGGTIENCLVQFNTSQNTLATNPTSPPKGTTIGAGLNLYGPNTKAIGCMVRGNKVVNAVTANSKAGGVNLDKGAQLINSVVYNNQSDKVAAGVYVSSGCNVVNCTIVKNKATGNGGGCYSTGGGGIIHNTISWGNTQGTNSAASDFYYNGTGLPFITDYVGYGVKTIYTNVTTDLYPTFANTKLLTSTLTASNTDDNLLATPALYAPRFLRPTTFVGCPVSQADTLAVLHANFNLTAGSPCLDYASSGFLSGINTDIMGNYRVAGLAADLGAYEYGSTLNGLSGIKNNLYTIYSNANQIIVKYLSGASEISVFGLSGIKYFQFVTSENSVSIPLTQKGIYLVRVKSGNSTETQKVIY